MKTKPLPDHLFVTGDGTLYDTRRREWFRNPVRVDYRTTFNTIETGAQLRATLRNGPSCWPGGYPLFFFTSDGGALSFQSVRDNLRSVLDSIRTGCNDGWRVVGCAVNWEDSGLYDDHSGERIESAYSPDDE